MQEHLLQQDFTGIFHTQGHHCKAVANEDNFHTRNVCDMTAGEVVGCENGDGLPFFVHGAYGIESNFLPQIWPGSTHGGMRAVSGLPLRQQHFYWG